MRDELLTIPHVERVEVYDARLPEPDDQAPPGVKIMAVFGCRIGPFAIRGAMLVQREATGAEVMMPRCRRRGAHITLTDPDVRLALQAAAERALLLLLTERGPRRG